MAAGEYKFYLQVPIVSYISERSERRTSERCYRHETEVCDSLSKQQLKQLTYYEICPTLYESRYENYEKEITKMLFTVQEK